MVKYENECCQCATALYPCAGDSCPNRHVKHLYCDKCGEDVEEIFEYDGKELCKKCLMKEFNVIRLIR